MTAPTWHYKLPEHTQYDDLIVNDARAFIYENDRWVPVRLWARMPWGKLQDDGERLAAQLGKQVKLVVFNPLSSAGEPQFFDVLPCVCLN